MDKYIERHFSPTVCTSNQEKAGNDVINALASENMEKHATRVPDVVWHEF